MAKCMLKFFYNGRDLGTDFKFSMNLNYQTLDIEKEGDHYVPSRYANTFENSWEAVELGDQIERLIKKLLMPEAQNYMFKYYTTPTYVGDIKVPIATNNTTSIKKAMDHQGDNLTVKILQVDYPKFDMYGNQTGIKEKFIFERQISIHEFIPFKGSYVPYFNKIYYDFDENEMPDYPSMHEEYDGKGIIYFLNYFMGKRDFTNRFLINDYL